MLKCPKCGYAQSYVIDSRSVDGGIKRRRECGSCGARFTTYESPKETAKKTILKELLPKLTANIKEAILKSIRELKD